MSKPTSKRVDNLKRTCVEARSAISRKFATRAIRPSDEHYGWGQYLEVVGQAADSDLGEQVGIYGTAAALQVLASDSAPQYRALITGGQPVLPLVASEPPANEQLRELYDYFVAKGDMRVAYKLASLLDTAIVLEIAGDDATTDEPRTNDVRDALLAIRIQGGGWPDYGANAEYHAANSHATAVALYSLSKSKLNQHAETACCEALEWLASQQTETQSIATLAMTTLAIRELQPKAPEGGRLFTDNIKSLLTQCERALLQWIRSTSPPEVLRALEGTEYWLPLQTTETKTGTRFTFLFYLPHCLASIAVLRSPRLLASRRGRRFVLGVVGIVAQRTKDQGHFVAAGRSMVSTVEHLWIYRLLSTFEHTTIYSRWRDLVDDRLRERRWGAPVAAAAVLAVLALAVSAAVTHGVLQVALGALSAAILGVSATVVYSLAKDAT